MKKIFLGLLLGATVFASDVIKVGISANYAPFDMMKDGKLAGYDVDLVNEIAKLIDAKVEFSNMAFDGLIPSLLAGKIDFISSGMSISERRAKTCDFSEPYFFGKTMYLKKKGDESLQSKADLKGVKTGVKMGTLQEQIARKLGANVVLHEDSAMIVASLENNHLKAIVFDSFVAKKFMAKSDDLVSFFEEPDGSAGFAFVFKKGANKELRMKINQALKTLENNGFIDKLKQKYDL